MVSPMLAPTPTTSHTPRPRRRPFTIAVTSGKGGVGKTSVSANLGAALCSAGKRTLLVDADLSLANLDILLGLEPKQTVADVLAGKCQVRDILLQGPGGLTLLPASSGVHQLSDLNDTQRANLLAGIETVESDFDIVIIDCPAGVGPDVQLFGGMADEVIVVATPDPTSLTDAYALMKVLNSERHRQRFRVVSSMVSSQVQARKIFRVLSSVSDAILSVQVDLLGWIPQDDSWRRAVMDRKLAYVTNPTTKGCTGASRVAQRLIALETGPRKATGGLGAALLGGAR